MADVQTLEDTLTQGRIILVSQQNLIRPHDGIVGYTAIGYARNRETHEAQLGEIEHIGEGYLNKNHVEDVLSIGIHHFAHTKILSNDPPVDREKLSPNYRTLDEYRANPPQADVIVYRDRFEKKARWSVFPATNVIGNDPTQYRGPHLTELLSQAEEIDIQEDLLRVRTHNNRYLVDLHTRPAPRNEEVITFVGMTTWGSSPTRK